MSELLNPAQDIHNHYINNTKGLQDEQHGISRNEETTRSCNHCPIHGKTWISTLSCFAPSSTRGKIMGFLLLIAGGGAILFVLAFIVIAAWLGIIWIKGRIVVRKQRQMMTIKRPSDYSPLIKLK